MVKERVYTYTGTAAYPSRARELTADVLVRSVLLNFLVLSCNLTLRSVL